jgi:hypothetical protein
MSPVLQQTTLACSPCYPTRCSSIQYHPDPDDFHRITLPSLGTISSRTPRRRSSTLTRLRNVNLGLSSQRKSQVLMRRQVHQKVRRVWPLGASRGCICKRRLGQQTDFSRYIDLILRAGIRPRRVKACQRCLRCSMLRSTGSLVNPQHNNLISIVCRKCMVKLLVLHKTLGSG